MDTEDPKFVKLMIENSPVAPKRRVPRIDIDEPTRPKLRRERELPICAKSITDTAEPKRPKDLRLRLDARRMASIVDNDDPRRT
jgi:hypothetical protein